MQEEMIYRHPQICSQSQEKSFKPKTLLTGMSSKVDSSRVSNFESLQYEGIITKGNEGFVHHIEVFHCQVGPHHTVASYNGPGMAEGKSPELAACREVIGAWAMGASVIII